MSITQPSVQLTRWPVEWVCSAQAEVAVLAFRTALPSFLRRCVKALPVCPTVCMFEDNLCRECSTLHLDFLVGGPGP